MVYGADIAAVMLYKFYCTLHLNCDEDICGEIATASGVGA
jgi:hypothetical protein